jgi:hypothetical protein
MDYFDLKSFMRTILFLALVMLVASCGDGRNAVSINGDKLYFDKTVSATKAATVLKWLQSVHHNWGEPKLDFQLSKQKGIYLFQYPVQIEGAENQEGNIQYIQTFADKMSADALDGEMVIVRLTDEDWEEEKRLVPSSFTVTTDSGK